MSDLQQIPAWIHRGCRIALKAHPQQPHCFEIRHSSGLFLGTTASLDHARELIDQELPLLRQRLVAAA